MTQEAQAHPNPKIPRKTAQGILCDYSYCLATAVDCIHHECEDYEDYGKYRECIESCIDDSACLQAISEEYDVLPEAIRELWLKS
jgi:beta-galactosidase/beta-glucuronidase